jgi:hypothetical protein
MSERERNPFKITTPEDLTAQEMEDLFVNVFTDFFQLTNPGHVFLKGPRGVGKSMMLRYLQVDCQCLDKGVPVEKLDFIGFYIPLKNTNFKMMELQQLDNKHASIVLNEHLMIAHCLAVVFDNLIMSGCYKGTDRLPQLEKLYKAFIDIFELEDKMDEIKEGEKSCESILGLMKNQILAVYRHSIKYVKKSDSLTPYTGELYDYIDYFLPLMDVMIECISDVKATIFLMLDDAHFLSEVQTKILNSWVASRTSRRVSLKISTQYDYKNFYTINGITIDTPHDYNEIDMATIYTVRNNNSSSTYHQRVEDIVKRRLEKFGIEGTPQSFFPPDQEQEERVRALEEAYNKRFDEGGGKGTNRTDDARRNARPDYIKSLGGTSKSSSTYSYSGFDQLVNISSGQVRAFLQTAFTMYAKTVARIDEKNNVEKISEIDSNVQNDVIREAANKFLFDEMEDRLQGDSRDLDAPYPKEDIEKLFNLIKGLGAYFREILLSDDAERRVFSIAITDDPSEVVKKTLAIGINLGYFHKSTIGLKESGSLGRTRLYVLNRRLAPIWNLDPNGFAGYKFLHNKEVEDLIKSPIPAAKSIAQRRRRQDDNQMSLAEYGLGI